MLRQIDEIDGIYNELNFKYEKLLEDYIELQKDYDYAVDVIRSTDKYTQFHE